MDLGLYERGLYSFWPGLCNPSSGSMAFRFTRNVDSSSCSGIRSVTRIASKARSLPSSSRPSVGEGEIFDKSCEKNCLPVRLSFAQRGSHPQSSRRRTSTSSKGGTSCCIRDPSWPGRALVSRRALRESSLSDPGCRTEDRKPKALLLSLPGPLDLEEAPAASVWAFRVDSGLQQTAVPAPFNVASFCLFVKLPRLRPRTEFRFHSPELEALFSVATACVDSTQVLLTTARASRKNRHSCYNILSQPTVPT